MRISELALAVGLAAVLNGCSAAVQVAPRGPDPKAAPAPAGPVASLKIPPGHYPPPGECRLWMPGQPPGQQPPPIACYELTGDVPAGAWVIYHPPGEKKLVEVTAYDSVRPGQVRWVRYFEMKTGRFVHEVLAN